MYIEPERPVVQSVMTYRTLACLWELAAIRRRSAASIVSQAVSRYAARASRELASTKRKDGEPR